MDPLYLLDFFLDFKKEKSSIESRLLFESLSSKNVTITFIAFFV